MEHSQHPFPKHTKTSKPSDLAKIIAVITFIFVVAGLVFYFRAHQTKMPIIELNTQQISEDQNEITGNIENINSPNAVDLGMVEDDLNQTEKGLKTIDNFENL